MGTWTIACNTVTMAVNLCTHPNSPRLKIEDILTMLPSCCHRCKTVGSQVYDGWWTVGMGRVQWAEEVGGRYRIW
jgi:hypothetical protein